MSTMELELLNSLKEAKELIRGWHGMGAQHGTEAAMWNIYNNNSPEMKRINSVIQKAEKQNKEYHEDEFPKWSEPAPPQSIQP